MLAEQRILEYSPKAITTRDVVSFLEITTGLELPLLLPIQRGHINATGNVYAVAHIADALQWSLDPIVDRLHQSRAQLHRQRFACSQDGVANCDTSCFFVDLDGGLIGLNADDFADELVMPNLAQLVHSTTDHVLGDDNGPGDGEDRAFILILLAFGSHLGGGI